MAYSTNDDALSALLSGLTPLWRLFDLFVPSGMQAAAASNQPALAPVR